MTSLRGLYEPVNERLAVNNLERLIVGGRSRVRGVGLKRGWRSKEGRPRLPVPFEVRAAFDV